MSVVRLLRRYWRRRPGIDLETYLTVGVAVSVGLLNLLGAVNSEIVSTATLSILAMVSFSLLRSHRPARHAATTPVGAVPTSIGPGRGPPPASDIRLVGVSLNRTIRSNLSTLERCLIAGGSVRVVVIDPGTAAPEEAARRSGVPTHGGIFAHRLRPTVDLLRLLAEAPQTADRLQVRLAPFVPSFGLVMVDPDAGHGWLSVEIYSHRPGGVEPSLTLTAEHHPQWYWHFRAEFDQIWTRARPVVAASDSW